MCNPSSAAGWAAGSAGAAVAAGLETTSVTAAGAAGTARNRVSGTTAVVRDERWMRTLTSPRSSSNSAISCALRNSMSSLISFRFIWKGGTFFYSRPPTSFAGECGTVSSTARSILYRDQFLGGRCEHVTPILRHHHHILNTDSPLARNVGSWLNCDHHPGLEYIRLVCGHTRRFVDLNSHSVAS